MIGLPPAERAAPRMNAAWVETPAVELAFELVDADLAGQVHGEGLSDRDHARIGGDRHGIADLVDRQERETRDCRGRNRRAAAFPGSSW